jgi:hypothetical protein
LFKHRGAVLAPPSNILPRTRRSVAKISGGASCQSRSEAIVIFCRRLVTSKTRLLSSLRLRSRLDALTARTGGRYGRGRGGKQRVHFGGRLGDVDQFAPGVS